MKFIKCEKCGKKIIVVDDDGKLHFKFGRRYGNGRSPVDITIDGDIEINCIRNGCDNILKIKKGDN